MPTEIHVPSSNRDVPAALLLRELQEIQPGGGKTVAVDFKPVLDAIAQLQALMLKIDSANDVTLEQLQEQIMSLTESFERIKTTFASYKAQIAQLNEVLTTTAMAKAKAEAELKTLQDLNAVLNAINLTDEQKIVSLQQLATEKDQTLAATQQEMTDAKAKRDSLQQEVDAVEQEMQALIPDAPANS